MHCHFVIWPFERSANERTLRRPRVNKLNGGLLAKHGLLVVRMSAVLLSLNVATGLETCEPTLQCFI